MADIYKRTTISLDKETSGRVDDYRYAKRIDNQNTALVLIIKAGLDAIESKEKEMAGLPQREKDLLIMYNAALPQMQKIAESVLMARPDLETAREIRRQIDEQTKKGPEA